MSRAGHQIQNRREAGTASSHLWRDRSRHEQLSPADRPAHRRGVYRHRRFLADRSAGRGPFAHGDCRTRRWIARSARSAVCAEKLRRRKVSLSRSVATEACRRAGNGSPVRRPGAGRNRHRARHHRARGGSAARGPRLPQAARAGRRPGADLRHRRRLDRMVLIDPEQDTPKNPSLVERALGRRLADGERRQGSA